jgi:hypothetical protein
MSWSTDPKIQAVCVARILEVTWMSDHTMRFRRALQWIEYLGAHPEEAGDRPMTYVSTLAAAAQSPLRYGRPPNDDTSSASG